jgi:hypothetical protein
VSDEPARDSTAPDEPRPVRSRAARRQHGARSGDLRPVTVLLALAVFGSVLALGAVHVPVLVAVAPCAFAAAALALRHQRDTRGALRIPFPAAAFALLAAYTLLQALPMPVAWLERLSPAGADVWARALVPFGEDGPRFASLSLDPGASVVEALKWLTYAAVLVAASTVAARRSAETGVAIVFCAAVAAALTTVAHGLAGASRVYGVYQPSVPVPAWHMGPLLNPNNLAGYLNLGALSGMGLLLSHKPPAPRWLIGLGIAVLVAVNVSSASRGGVLALPVGVALLAFLISRRAKDRGREMPSSAKWLLGAVLVGGSVLALLGGNRAAFGELVDENIEKLDMLLWARPMLRDYPIFGIGRGAFESVFPAYRTTAGHVVYTHAECFPAQWLAEWGVPVGAAALLAFAYALRPTRLGVTRSTLCAGAYAGVAILVLQNLVDLGFEVPAVCIALTTVLGSLWGNVRGPRGDREGHASRLAGIAPSLAAAAGLALPILAFRLGAPDVAAERERVRAAYEAMAPGDEPARERLRAALHTAMRRHPAEPYFPLVGALSAFRTRTESPLPWLQRTLERAHVNGRAHLLLAQVLEARGARRQALFELRLVVEQDQGLVGVAGTLAVRWTQTYDELALALPEENPRRAALLLDEMAVQARAAGLSDLRARCDDEAIKRDTGAFGPHLRQAEALLAALDKKEPGGPCEDRARCARLIEQHATALDAARPEASVAARIRASLMIAEGHPDEAEALLAARCGRATDRSECLRARVQAAGKTGSPEKLAAASKDLLAAACLSAVACADAATWLGDLRASRNETGNALALYARAAREDPTEARWLRLADAASRSGAHAQAVDALERAAQKHGAPDEGLRKRIAEERAKAMGATPLPTP